MKKRLSLVAAALVLAAGSAHAQSVACGGQLQPLPEVKPIFQNRADLDNSSFDCIAWQDFIYLNWPALLVSRGLPDPAAKFGAAGPTVWETYRTIDTVFLPNGQSPGPWAKPALMATLENSLAQRVADGKVRNLTMTSKISRHTMASFLTNKAGIPQTVLDQIEQVGGGTLYDLNGYPVYYEIAMNEMEYDYILDNGLYNADKQAAFAQTHVISLPANTDDEKGSVEVKAAWKVLSGSDNKAHFHTIQALLDGGKTPVTVGLVGFHIFIANGLQGAWATFAQVENAPVATPAASGTFNFFNPACKQGGSACPVNSEGTDPTQVVQVTPDDHTADLFNAYMHDVLKKYDPTTPWLYYKLVNVQWALNPVGISTLPAPQNTPLPNGNPNTPTLVNAVIETFAQNEGTGCLLCHQIAGTAGQSSFAAGYSFVFGHATAPK